jgi:hypothetical protein
LNADKPVNASVLEDIKKGSAPIKLVKLSGCEGLFYF